MLSDINIRHLDVGQACGITANTPNIGRRCQAPENITGASYFHKNKSQCLLMSYKNVKKARLRSY